MNTSSQETTGTSQVQSSVVASDCDASHSCQSQEKTAPIEVSITELVEAARQKLIEYGEAAKDRISVTTLIKGYDRVSEAQAVDRIASELHLDKAAASVAVDIIRQAGLLKDPDEAKGKRLEAAVQAALRQYGLDYEHDMPNYASHTDASAYVDFTVYGTLRGTKVAKANTKDLAIEVKYVGCGAPDPERLQMMERQARIEGLVSKASVVLLVYGNEQALQCKLFDMTSLRSKTIDETVILVNRRRAEKAKQELAPRQFYQQRHTTRQNYYRSRRSMGYLNTNHGGNSS